MLLSPETWCPMLSTEHGQNNLNIGRIQIFCHIVCLNALLAALVPESNAEDKSSTCVMIKEAETNKKPN